MENKKTREKDSFTAVRHYIKSPIYILKGYLDSLLSGDLGDLDEKQKKYVGICMDNAERMGHIIERLLSVVEIEDGKYEVKMEKADIVKVAEDVLTSSLPLARASNTKTSLTTEGSVIFVRTDEEKITASLGSLVDNAIKYKGPGEGKVEIEIRKRDEEAVCSVKDNGIGVSEEEGEKMFDKFYRGERAIEIDPNSLGLDLYISRAVINASGGKMWVEKNEGEGSTLYFTLPLYNQQ